MDKWINGWMGSGFKEKRMAELSSEGQYLGKERKWGLGEGVLGRQSTMLKCPKMFKCPNPAVFEEVKQFNWTERACGRQRGRFERRGTGNGGIRAQRTPLSTLSEFRFYLYGQGEANEQFYAAKEYSQIFGLSWWSSGEESDLQCRGQRFDPWSGD